MVDLGHKIIYWCQSSLVKSSPGLFFVHLINQANTSYYLWMHQINNLVHTFAQSNYWKIELRYINSEVQKIGSSRAQIPFTFCVSRISCSFQSRWMVRYLKYAGSIHLGIPWTQNVPALCIFCSILIANFPISQTFSKFKCWLESCVSLAKYLTSLSFSLFPWVIWRLKEIMHVKQCLAFNKWLLYF